jgi:hypothetical protein
LPQDENRVAMTLGKTQDERMNQYPPKLCPRFDACSVNNCPVDPAYPTLFVDPKDKAKVCPMEKGVRLRIAVSFPFLLPMLGHTTREWAGKQRYDSLSPAVKAQMAKQCRDNLSLQRPIKQP